MIKERKLDPNYNPDWWFNDFIETIRPKAIGAKRKAYQVLDIDGNPIQTTSGKSVWGSKGAASGAITNSLSGYSYNNHYKYDPIYKDIIDYRDRAEIHRKYPEIADKWSDKIKEKFPRPGDLRKYLLNNGHLSIVEVK